MSTEIYEFDERDPSEAWDTDPDNMVDGVETNYASTGSDGDQEKLTGNDCPGSDLGTISKVELRFYGQGDENDQVGLRPIFGVQYGDYHWEAPGISPGWKTWHDITNDPNAPSPWTWPEVYWLMCRVEYNKVGKGNPIYVGMVQIQVTYEPSGPPAYYHGLKVQGEAAELALCDVGSNPVRFRKGGTTFGIEVVAVDDPNASRVRTKTPAGVKAIRKYT